MSRHFDAYRRRQIREHNQLAWHAWHVAALSRAQRLTPLKKLIVSTAKPKRRQSWQDQLAVVMRWDAAINRQQVAAQ